MTIPATLMIPLSLISAFLLFHGAFFSYALGISLFFSILVTSHLGFFSLQNSSSAIVQAQELLAWAVGLPFYQTLVILGLTLLTTYLITRFWKQGAPVILILLAPVSVLPTVSLLIHQPISYRVSAIVYILVTVTVFIARYRSHQWTAIISSSVAGGVALALLFASFYYFTAMVTVTLALILIGSGILVQNSTRRKREETARNSEEDIPQD